MSKEHEKIRAKVAREYNGQIRDLKEQLAVCKENERFYKQLATTAESKNKELESKLNCLISKLSEASGKSIEEINEWLDKQMSTTNGLEALNTLATLMSRFGV